MALIVGLAGKAGSGKDTVGNWLVLEHGFVRMALADVMRECLMDLDPYVGHDIRLSDLVMSGGWDSAKRRNPEVRRLLQTFGTEVIRHRRPSFWIEMMQDRIDRLGPDPRVAITDVRFDNEAEWILRGDRLNQVVEIVRDQHDTAAVNGHSSETGLSPKLISLRINNNGTLDDLYVRLREVFGDATR